MDLPNSLSVLKIVYTDHNFLLWWSTIPIFFAGFFLTKIFHPNVSSKGEICVNTLKKDWKSDLGLKHILLTIKCLLIVPNPESALNEEAGKLLLEQYDTYSSRAKLYTEIHASVKSSSSKTEVS